MLAGCFFGQPGKFAGLVIYFKYNRFCKPNVFTATAAGLTLFVLVGGTTPVNAAIDAIVITDRPIVNFMIICA
jgi:hypothetical protein